VNGHVLGAGDGTGRRGTTGLALAELLTAGALCLAACDGSSASKPAAASRYCSIRRSEAEAPLCNRGRGVCGWRHAAGRISRRATACPRYTLARLGRLPYGRERAAGEVGDTGLHVGRLAGAKTPPDADQAVIPDPRRLEQAALTVLSAEVVIVDPSVNDPAFAQAETESPIDAVDLANQSRCSQEGSGPCAGCVRSPADPDNPCRAPGRS
jgi:hypothetical protein